MTEQNTEGAVRILIGQRGWVWVGRYVEYFDEVILSEARNIRRWGTSGGLGQLAEEGPQSNTVLDPAGTVRLHRLAVIATLDAKESVWVSHLG